MSDSVKSSRKKRVKHSFWRNIPKVAEHPGGAVRWADAAGARAQSARRDWKVKKQQEHAALLRTGALRGRTERGW